MSDGGAPNVGIWIFPDAPAPQLVELASHADSLGLDEFWLGDEGPAREPFAVLAAAAVSTDRIRLATGITNPYVRHAGIAAAAILTVHELSAGRALLGVGAGGQMSLAPFGLEAERPVRRVEAFLEMARAVVSGTESDDYTPPELALNEAMVGARLPIYVGARGERLNRLASAQADGVFVAGMPPFRYEQVIGWARSVRPIDVALYPSVAFTAAAAERHRPEMIWSLLDTPAAVREELGLDLALIEQAAAAMQSGDPEPARSLVDDRVLERVMLLGTPVEIGSSLAALVREHSPASVGLALLQDDLHEGITHASAAFAAMHAELEPS